jgi:hypothetical protein
LTISVTASIELMRPASITCGRPDTFLSLSSTTAGSRNASRGRSRFIRTVSSKSDSGVVSACSKPWWSNQSALPIWTNFSGAWRMNSSSGLLKRYSKLRKNADWPPATLNG